jgi:hypothetical protein
MIISVLNLPLAALIVQRSKKRLLENTKRSKIIVVLAPVTMMRTKKKICRCANVNSVINLTPSALFLIRKHRTRI